MNSDIAATALAAAREAAGAAAEGSPHYWRRMTARRLLVEGQQTAAVPRLSALARESTEAFAAINALGGEFS